MNANLLRLRLGLAPAVLFCAALPATADTIYLLDGEALEDVEVGEETVEEIEYRDGSKRETVKTDDVLRIEFTSKSQLVDRGDTAAADGQVFAAITDFETFVEGHLASGRRPRYKWEPAYAMDRLIELNAMVGDAEQTIAAADRLIEEVPESRHTPEAYLTKAETQFLTGDAAGAAKTLDTFQNYIQGQRLSQRWSLEHRLASALFDPELRGERLRDKLESISGEAGSAYPLVKNAAEVAVAESLLSEKQFDEAEPIFQRVTDNPKASDATLAAAYTGLGDCLFKRATESSDEAEKAKLLRDAKLAYMRVVVVHKDQVRYVPKAMFWAGRVYDQSQDEGDKKKAEELYAKVLRDYQGSKWAEEARGFYRR